MYMYQVIFYCVPSIAFAELFVEIIWGLEWYHLPPERIYIYFCKVPGSTGGFGSFQAHFRDCYGSQLFCSPWMSLSRYRSSLTWGAVLQGPNPKEGYTRGLPWIPVPVTSAPRATLSSQPHRLSWFPPGPLSSCLFTILSAFWSLQTRVF